MDSKKTNLTPELKEIYDRVMNTSAGTPPPNNANGGLPTTPPSNQNPASVPGSGVPEMPNAMNQMPATPTLGTPPVVPGANGLGTPPAVAQVPPAAGGSADPLAAVPQMPPLNATLEAPIMPSAAEQALTSTPARPLNEGNTFSFNGVGQTPSPAPAVGGASATAPTAKEKKKTKISLPIIIVLALVFIAVWGVFWAIIFGFIQR